MTCWLSLSRVYVYIYIIYIDIHTHTYIYNYGGKWSLYIVYDSICIRVYTWEPNFFGGGKQHSPRICISSPFRKWILAPRPKALGLLTHLWTLGHAWTKGFCPGKIGDLIWKKWHCLAYTIHPSIHPSEKRWFDQKKNDGSTWFDMISQGPIEI
jgi:hypothetical protein